MASLIRKWTLEDLPTIQNVLWKTWVDSYSTFIPERDLKSYFGEHYDVEALKELFRNPLVSGYVAEVDGAVVGFMRTTKDWEENQFYVSSIYLLPQFQGKGLGRQLMVKAAEEAFAAKLDKIWVGVMMQNEQAYEWYKKMGYTIVRTEPFRMGNSLVDHYIGYISVEALLPKPSNELIAS